MAAPKLKKGVGNSASTTLASSVTTGDTSFPLTASTNFQAASGEGTVLIDEGAATEEIGYSTGLSGGALTIPLANRGLEGGSAQAHAASASVKGVFTVGAWNDVIDSLANVLVPSTGALDTTKVVTLTGSQVLTNKQLSNPLISGSAQSTIALSGTTPTIDLTGLANIWTLTLTGNTTFSCTTGTGKVFMVEVKQGSGTTYTITWFAGITWLTSGGTAPVQTAVSNGYTTYGFRCTGTNTYLGYLVGTN